MAIEMKQNIYDEPEFFAGYMALRAAESGLNAAIEEPAVDSLLPQLSGRRVLDLGCGFGKFARYCLDQDAKRFLGFDISEKMIAEARRRVQDDRASFVLGAVEDVELEKDSFDLVVSSMCLHYVRDIRSTFEKIACALRPGGRLIFSVEHPVCTALLKGWYDAQETPRLHWPVDDYFSEGIRHSRWFVDGVIKYHRTVETYVSGVLSAELSLAKLLEPAPAADAVARQPCLAEHVRRPAVQVMACDKGVSA